MRPAIAKGCTPLV